MVSMRPKDCDSRSKHGCLEEGLPGRCLNDCTLVIYNLGLPVAYALYLFLSFASVTTAWNFHPKSTYKSTASSCSTMCVILPATNFPRGLPSFTKSDFRNISSNVSASELSGALKHVLLPVIFELKATQFLWKNVNVLDAFTNPRQAVAILDTNAGRVAVSKHIVVTNYAQTCSDSL